MSKYKYGLKKYLARMLLNSAVNIFVTSDSTPTAKLLVAIKAVVHKKLQAPGSKSLKERGTFLMWLGNLLKMVVQEYHGDLRKVVLWLEEQRIQ